MKPSPGAPEPHHNGPRTHICTHPAGKSSCSKPIILWFPSPAAIVQRQRGVTGMETAIILMAFVVIASIYSFTVLSTGIFSSDKGKETIHAGLGEVSGPVELEGSAIGERSPDTAPPRGESLGTAVATSSSGYHVGPTADTVDKKEDFASANVAPSATSSINILAPRTPPPPSLIVDLVSPQL